ncbi:hypothetical protein [Geodermatophilus sp. SYSU D00698]
MCHAPACALGAVVLLPGQALPAAYAGSTALLLLRHGAGRRRAAPPAADPGAGPCVAEPGYVAAVVARPPR